MSNDEQSPISRVESRNRTMYLALMLFETCGNTQYDRRVESRERLPHHHIGDHMWSRGIRDRNAEHGVTRPGQLAAIMRSRNPVSGQLRPPSPIGVAPHRGLVGIGVSTRGNCGERRVRVALNRTHNPV
jgi:hypothetical protein